MGPWLAWRCLRFATHVAIVYGVVQFVTPGWAGWTYRSLLPLLHVRTSALSGFDFLFSNLAILSLAPAFLVALLTFRFRDKSTAFVWVVPAAVLAYKVATYMAPSMAPSVLESGGMSGLHYYLGSNFAISEFHSWREFWDLVATNPDMLRGMAQLRFTAPFYAGIGYSLAAWICLRTSVDQKFVASLHGWEEERFSARSKHGSDEDKGPPQPQAADAPTVESTERPE
jgi:hypothetical protein